MQKRLLLAALAALMLVATAVPALAVSDNAAAGFAELYHDGDVVRTVVPPAAAPKTGIDDIFVITNGVDGQLPIAAVAPGDRGYHGGKWAVHLVEWVDPDGSALLTSASAVHTYAVAGLVTIERVPEADFKCPIQP